MKKRYETESLHQIRNRHEKTYKMSSVDNTTGCRNEADDEREKKGNSGGSIEVADLMTSPQGALEIEIKPLSEEDVSVRTINLQSS